MNFASMKNYKRIAASVGLATLMTVAVAAPAFAAEDDVSVSATITGGLTELIITSEDISFDELNYNYADAQDQTAGITYTMDDPRGTGAGWQVQIQASVLDYLGDHPTQADLEIQMTSVAAATLESGQSADGLAEGSVVADITTEAVAVLTAAADEGQGKYEQVLGFSIPIPAGTAAGSYDGTVTLTEVAAPGGEG